MLVVCSCQNIIDHYLKVLGKILNEVVPRCLCSVFQTLMKVAFKNLYLVATYKLQNCSFH